MVIYGHTFSRYSHKWLCYFCTLPMVTNELHWWLLILLVKSHFKLSIILPWKKVLEDKVTANIVS